MSKSFCERHWSVFEMARVIFIGSAFGTLYGSGVAALTWTIAKPQGGIGFACTLVISTLFASYFVFKVLAEATARGFLVGHDIGGMLNFVDACERSVKVAYTLALLAGVTLLWCGVVR